MTCTVDPNHPHLRKWLSEGLNIDVHTVDHPCPLLKDNDFAKAKSTVDRCIDLLNLIPGNKPVAFRMPCCDSLNTPSPRFYAEIFNKTTPHGKFLTIDTSVFCVLTPNDPELPKELTTDPDGKEKFRKYIPFPSFVNTIEDYPYPYVIGKLCWQFPCIVPSDWEAQNLNKPNSPVTVADMKAALDAVVLKQGTFNFVFHPHNWIKAEQVVEIIDYAVEKHGKKVKFLNFREAQERLDKNLLADRPLRLPNGGDNGVRILDVNHDGYMDVFTPESTRIWRAKERTWEQLANPGAMKERLQFGVVHESGRASVVRSNHGGWHFNGTEWVTDPAFARGADRLSDYRLRDLDGDGVCELINGLGPNRDPVRRWGRDGWVLLPFRIPEPWADDGWIDNGLRFVDLNGDRKEDLVCSGNGWSVYLFKDMQVGWEKISAGNHADPGAIPKIVRDRTNNGAWFHSKHLWVQNEDTAKMPNLVDRRSFEDLLKPR
jgi:hypothetical protein